MRVHTDVIQTREKPRIDGRTGLHAHGNEQNEKFTYILLSIRYGNYRGNWYERAINRLGIWCSCARL